MHYFAFPQALQSSDLGCYTGWGIEGVSPEGTVFRVEDVTCDEDDAALLAAVLTQEAVEPVHLLDVISDLVAEPDALRTLSQKTIIEQKNALLGCRNGV